MRKITRTRTGNKNRLYYIFGIIAFCTFASIGIGYSILTSVVRVDGTTSITSTWRIVFTDAKEKTMDKATTKAGPTITGGTSLSLSVELDEPGSQATYDVTVQNQGTIDAVVKEIRFNDGEPNDLKVVVSNLYKGFPLKAGESKTFQVIARWDPSVPESSETEEDIKIDVDFEQETNDSQKPVLSMPTYTVDYPNEVWTKEKNVTMKYPTGEGLIYQYSTDGGKSWKIAPASTYVLKFTNDGTLYIRVSDGKSVLTTPLILIERTDNTVPSVSISGNDSNWTASKTLTIQATDKESGLASNPYSWDGGSSWKTVSGTSQKLTFTENGTVIARVRDTGNTNNTVTASTLTIQFPINMLKSDLRLGSLTSIEFVNDIAPEGTDYIDVSEAQNGSIQLWGNGLNSYIGSTKKIYGNPDSSYLFTSTSTLVSSNLETINFNDYFDTSKVTNMSYMFSNAYQLTSLDLSKWNTSSLIAFGDMFDCCDKLNVSIKLNGIQWFEFTMQNYSFYGSRPPISITIYGDGTNESEILEMINQLDFEHVMTYAGVKN